MKKIWLALLACMSFILMAFGVSCGSKLAFNEGYIKEYTLGETILLDEYVDVELMDSLGCDYTAVLKHKKVGTYNLKDNFSFTPEEPGTYTLIYKVKDGEYKGEISTKIKVVVPDISWTYSTPELGYRVGETLNFAYLKRSLNLVVKSYYDWSFFVQSVKYGDQVVEFTDENEYTFQESGETTITFGVRTEDGQVLTTDYKMNVRVEQVLADGAAEWMEQNNITTHDYTYINPNGKVSFDAGYYTTTTNDNVPYLAFNGNNGNGYKLQNTYVMVDFTGKDLPQIAFGCDEVTSSYMDGKPGILFTNGITNNNGTAYFSRDPLNWSRLTIFGPNKISFPEFDNRARMWATGSTGDPHPMSYNALVEGNQYRYIVGFSAATSTRVTVRILLINLTTSERVYDATQALTNSSGIGNLNLSDKMLNNGKIVLYGRYGRALTFDKVHLPYTNVADIYELDVAATMKTSYKAQVDLNETARVTDFIDIPDGDYMFKVTDPDGEAVEIEDGEFQYTKSGKYLIQYDPKQDGVRPAAVTVQVMYDTTNALPEDTLEIDGAIMASGQFGVTPSTVKDYIIEGSQSLRYYAISETTADKGLIVYLSRSLIDFLFLSRDVDGISFDVYTHDALNFKLSDEGNANNLLQDYTGALTAEEWTTLTITRELCMKNAEAYRSKGYVLGICFYTDTKLPAQTEVYIDNIKLLTSEKPTTISTAAQTFLTNNNISAHAVQSINDDMQVAMYQGMYQGTWDTMKNDDVPYLAYNGNYGKGTYIAVDFTGKNVPQFSFFSKEVTSSLTDGNAGLYVHTGMVKKNGAISSTTNDGRVTFLGPNKIQFARPDSEGRVGMQYGYNGWSYNETTKTNVADKQLVDSPLSIKGLQDGVHYRYVIGVKDAVRETDKGIITLEILLINLDTGAKVVYYETGRHIAHADFTADYISGGNVVMYGRYNTPITLDKIYAAYTNVSDIYSIDVVSNVLN